MFCKECGNLLDNNQIICPNCGHKVNSPANFSKVALNSHSLDNNETIGEEKDKLTKQREKEYLKRKLLPFFVFDCFAMQLFVASALALFPVDGKWIIIWILSLLVFLFIFALLPYLSVKHRFVKLCKKINDMGVNFEMLLQKLSEVKPYPFVVGCNLYFNNEYICINYIDDLEIFPIRDLYSIDPVHLVTTTRAGLIPVSKEVSDFVTLKFANSKEIKLITISEFNTMRLTRELSLAKNGIPITSSSVYENTAENKTDMNTSSSNKHHSIKLTSKRAKTIRRKCAFTKAKDWIFGSILITCIFLLPMSVFFYHLGVEFLLVWIGITAIWLFGTIVCPVLSGLKSFNKECYSIPNLNEILDSLGKNDYIVSNERYKISFNNSVILVIGKNFYLIKKMDEVNSIQPMNYGTSHNESKHGLSIAFNRGEQIVIYLKNENQLNVLCQAMLTAKDGDLVTNGDIIDFFK